MVLIIDNYDSFTYNLVQLAGSIHPDFQVIRNDEKTVEEIRAIHPTHIILSPGPGYPKAAGVCEDVVRALGGEIPILGVCLGHQAICEVYGAKICLAKHLMHGKQSEVEVDGNNPLFAGLPGTIRVARYHSLIASEEQFPDCLQVISRDTQLGEIMAVCHKKDLVYGVQFHPESILTPEGKVMMENFLKMKMPMA